MKPFCFALLVACAFSTARAAEDIVIFSGGERFRKNWIASTWGGLDVRDDGEGENGGAVVAAVPTEKAQPWSGFSLQVAYDQNKAVAAIPLDDDLREHGVVVVRVNCGKDRSGQPGAGQALQAGLSFLVGGERKAVPPTPLSQLGGEANLDGDPESWQEIRIPIAAMLKKLPDPAAAEGILSVGLQYVDAPACEILVSDCRIKSE